MIRALPSWYGWGETPELRGSLPFLDSCIAGKRIIQSRDTRGAWLGRRLLPGSSVNLAASLETLQKLGTGTSLLSDSSHFGKHQIALKCDNGFRQCLPRDDVFYSENLSLGLLGLFGLPDQRPLAPW